jgi:hypothetical protein
MPEANPYLDDVAALRSEVERLRAAIRLALSELGPVPGFAAGDSAMFVLQDALDEPTAA